MILVVVGVILVVVGVILVVVIRVPALVVATNLLLISAGLVAIEGEVTYGSARDARATKTSRNAANVRDRRKVGISVAFSYQ